MERVKALQKKYKIDLLYDVFLRESDSLFFIIEGVKDTTTKPLIPLFGDCSLFNISCDATTLEDIISKIDQKSEICDILGFKEYVTELKRELDADQTKTVLYFPLVIDGVKHYLELKAFKFFEQGVTIILFNPVDLKKVNLEMLYFESYKDSLTGLFNYNTLLLHLSKAYGDHFFGFIDLDHFKLINDTYGHNRGDEVLALVGKKLIEIADEHVIMYRKSGDEFIFMTIDLDKEKTMALVKKIQEVIRSIHLPALKTDCSIGVVEYKDNNGLYDVYDAIALADIAMYMSKKNGRGQVTHIDEDEVRSIVAFGPLEETSDSLKSKGC
ncbi:MAG: GGDEF domain-containing protein [Bacilli bacterium]